MSASTTYSDAINSMVANAGYRAAGDSVMANAFVTAATILTVVRPQFQSHGERGGEQLRFDNGELIRLIADARKFIKEKASTPGSWRGMRIPGEYCEGAR